MRAALAMAGYIGCVLLSRLPCMTPEDTAIFLGGAAFTAGLVSMPLRMPPMVLPLPPISPPMTPLRLAAGAASELIILIVFGILVGARRVLSNISDTARTCLICTCGG